jgi:ankyrin repeat protein
MKEDYNNSKHYFLKNMPIVSANGFSIDVWQAMLVNQEMVTNSLFQQSTNWIRSMQNDPQCLIKSVKNGDLRGVMDAVDANISVNLTDIKGRTALHLSVKNCSEKGLQITKFLLLKNARTEIEDSSRYRRTSLLAAVKANNIDAVRLLLDENAYIDATDAMGRTSLIYAAEHEYDDIKELLIERGADKSCVDSIGRTAKLASKQDGNEFWSLFGTWGGRDYEEDMF